MLMAEDVSFFFVIACFIAAVYADGELIYENNGSGSVYMKANGNVWHTILGDAQSYK